MSQPDSPDKRETNAAFSSAAGCALTAIGLLILIPSGLCTALMLPSVFTNGAVGISGVLGFGMAAAVGAALVYAGFKIGQRE